MKIRNIYTTPVEEMNNTKTMFNPVSLTVPGEALTVDELFERYTTGIVTRQEALAANKMEFDGFNDLSPDDVDPDLDNMEANEVYERQYELKMNQYEKKKAKQAETNSEGSTPPPPDEDTDDSSESQ